MITISILFIIYSIFVKNIEAINYHIHITSFYRNYQPVYVGTIKIKVEKQPIQNGTRTISTIDGNMINAEQIISRYKYLIVDQNRSEVIQ